MIDIALGDELSDRSIGNIGLREVDFESDSIDLDRLLLVRFQVIRQELLDLRPDRVSGVLFLIELRHRKDTVGIDGEDRDRNPLRDSTIVFGNDEARIVVGDDARRVVCQLRHRLFRRVAILLQKENVSHSDTLELHPPVFDALENECV